MIKLIKGVNDFATWCKTNDKQDLLEEWDVSNEIFPDQISYGSHKRIKWICKNGHHYEKDVHSRCQGTGCSECSGINFEHRRKLFEEYPSLIYELDLTKNSLESVKDITCASKKIIIWKCEQGHSYEMSALNKIRSKGCPYCNNKRILEGENDLETWCNQNNRQQILDDWDYTKNDFSPKDITYGSSRQAYFKCHICGYEWHTTINSRTSNGSDCRMCSRRINSSFPEQCIFYYVSFYFNDAVNGDHNALDGKELDIYIPSLNFAIEYDGKTWHKDTDKDVNKDKLCKDKGIVLYRVREYGCEELSSNESIIFEYNYADWHILSKIIIKILIDVGIENPNVDIVRDEYFIKESYYTKTLENSLKKLYPEVAKEWLYEKNGNITPDLIVPQTHDNYYWKCSKCGKIFRASPHNRINANSGCPKCGAEKAHRSQSFAVINLDTGERFETVDDAASKYALSRRSIGVCCRGITKTCGEYRWQYDLEQLSETHVAASVRRSTANAYKQKPVINLDTGQIYDTLKDASVKTGIHNISACCRGVREKAGSYHWAYYDKNKAEPILSDPKYVVQNFDRKMNVSNKTTGEIFNSLTDACKVYNVSLKTLSLACRGITKKPVCGCMWSYIQKEK